jgi:DtxR family Mn-dependent transcriptional regulator
MANTNSESSVLLDHILEILYMKREDRETISLEELLRTEHFDHRFTPELVEKAIANGHVSRYETDLSLTDKGLTRATMVLRCNRLAERLLVDVLRVRDEIVEPSACRFEHILSEEVADSICTLLGHPRTCPHNKEIPPGACCRRASRAVQPIVRPLSGLSPGEEGVVAYINSRFHVRLTRLASMGLFPGQKVLVRQVRPSFIISYGETELALEKEVAAEIYLRISSNHLG